jgi:hypothetical protein
MQVKNRIGQMKSLMEQRRVERAMQVPYAFQTKASTQTLSEIPKRQS